ncbi:MAG: 30S ribosomal protein S20 [Candidatus Tectomicrobia bacterium]|uniref:Small ribosomal subunit protein bS20 n=1 Tax=Tectimicrobiota bacterium TaxID=2528274 RepID=A0A932FW53_UNCTE|nr:30S ribosomal protein S20 [Candidatus Tectomicrobia bacterium]
MKRARQGQDRRARNMSLRSSVKTSVKKVEQVLQSKNPQTLEQELRHAATMLDKASSKGVIPRRRASRKISRLSRRVSAVLKPAVGA